MSKKCPMCGENKTGEDLFCPDCTEKLNSEYEVVVPISEEPEEVLPPSNDEIEAEIPQLNDSEPDAEEFVIERRVKVVPAPNFDKRAWTRQREDKLVGSDKSFYELSKEGKTNKVLAIILSIVVLVGALIAGLYIYNNGVKKDNLERSKWEVAQRHNTVDSYRIYIDEYPQGEFSDEAFKSMLLLKNIEAEAYENLKTSESIIEFTEFLEQYPKSSFQRIVKGRLDSLMWSSSLQENSVEAYSRYINSVTTHEILGDYIGEAEKRFKMLDQSTPIDEADLEQLKRTVDGFFVGVSSLSHTTLSEHLAPEVIRYNNKTNLSSDQMIGQLMLQAATENAASLRLEAEIAKLTYKRLNNDTYEVNVPLQKIFEENGGSINQIKGYIVHIKLDLSFKIYSYHETKPYTGAP